MSDVKNTIANGKAVLGIEFGSTRIKAVLVDENNMPIASGDHDWENRLENGVWTYTLEDIWTGAAGLLSEDDRRCKGKIWCGSGEAGSHRIQCHDAWISGI